MSVLDRAVSQFEIIASRKTLAELAATLAKPKFAAKMSKREAQLSLEVMIKHMALVAVTEVVSECRHPPDNKFLELAASGDAAVIITGDNDLLALQPWRGVSILTPRQFLDMAVPVER